MTKLKDVAASPDEPDREASPKIHGMCIERGIKPIGQVDFYISRSKADPYHGRSFAADAVFFGVRVDAVVCHYDDHEGAAEEMLAKVHAVTFEDLLAKMESDLPHLERRRDSLIAQAATAAEDAKWLRQAVDKMHDIKDKK